MTTPDPDGGEKVRESVKRPDVNDPASAASRFRRRRFRMVEDLIRPMLPESGRLRILDVGGRRDYWDLVDPELAPRLSLTIMNNEPVELDDHRRDDDPIEVDYVLGDATAMPEYGDGAFDLVHSNSVIEHVGGLTAMARMADEIRRVGRAYYVQTPYLWFPIEPHYGVPFFHWLPKAARARINARRKVGYRPKAPSYREALAWIDHTELVDQTLMRALFPDGKLVKERVALLVKSLIVLRPAAD
jgi:hypothetical protein